VSAWQRAAAEELSTVVGYLASSVAMASPAVHNLVTDSWLFAVPTGDIVMTNSGGIRQGIPAGDITLGTVVGILPFQNTLVELELTGQEVVDCLTGSTVVAGMTTLGGYFHADGTPLKADSLYHVLTTDYLYSVQSSCFQVYDPDPYDTGLTYYQPTVSYLEFLDTSPADPLDNYLDLAPRR
jgi:2',3'-cyclic-nucleotide 2'-phosphodiesterase (5'-nucleotidase family)